MSNSKLMVPGKVRWWGGPSVHQRFSLPPSIIYYIAKNPSNSKVYSKLIKTSKYFFETNPVLVAADMYYSHNDEAIKICPDKECEGDEECCVELDIKKTVAQAWLTNLIFLSNLEIPNDTSLLCSKIYQSEVINLCLCLQNIAYEDFKALIPCVRDLKLSNVEMKYADGSCVMLETIIEALPYIEQFEYKFKPGHSSADATTMKKIAALENFGSLKSFRLCNIPDSFKVQDMSDFITSHADTKFYFSFGSNLSDGYKAQLDALIDTVIESEIAGCVVEYHGQDEEKFYHMYNNYYV